MCMLIEKIEKETFLQHDQDQFIVGKFLVHLSGIRSQTKHFKAAILNW